jgi:hypothetical protein
MSLNLSFIAMAYLGRSLGPTVLIFIMITVSYALVGALVFSRKKSGTLVIARAFQHNASEPVVQSSTKLVNMKSEAAIAEQ